MTPAEIAELRELISGEFGRVHARLDSMDGRLDSMDGRLDSMDGRLDSMDGRLDSMDGRLDSMDGRLDSMDGRLDSMDGRLDGMDQRLDGMDQRLDSMDGRLESVGGGLAELTKRVDELHDDQQRFQELVGHHFNDVLTRLRKVEILGEARDHDFKAFGEILEDIKRGNVEFREEVRERFDRVEYRLGHLEAA